MDTPGTYFSINAQGFYAPAVLELYFQEEAMIGKGEAAECRFETMRV
jgi:hypothetical protein